MQAKGRLQATSEHVSYCFDSLLAHFAGVSVANPGFEDLCCPLFVTWSKDSRRGTPRLRGCIGTLEAKYLFQALKDYALTSALADRRFSPIVQDELPALTCTVSLLCCFEHASSWLDWSVGQHGLIVEFVDPCNACKRNATFLPEIAEQEGWSQQQTIDALISKSGYEAQITSQLRDSLRITRYESTLCSLTYKEYLGQKQPALLSQAVMA